MRHALILTTTAALFSTLTTAFHFPDFQSFCLPISLSDYVPSADVLNQTAFEHADLLRRYSNTCPTDFNSCSNLGAPQLCCASAAVCSPDAAGNVACCPSGAACSGTISGVITAGTVNAQGSLIGVATTAGTSTNTGGVVGASTTSSTTSDGLVLASTQTSTTTTTTGSEAVSATGQTGFIIDGTSTVATPAGAVRAADVVSHIQ